MFDPVKGWDRNRAKAQQSVLSLATAPSLESGFEIADPLLSITRSKLYTTRHVAESS